MNKLALTSLIAASLSFGQAYATDALDLEPSINGEVSAYGGYSTQAQEDQALLAASEPCIYGDFKTSSLYMEKVAQNVVRHRQLTRDSESQFASVR